MVPGTKAIICAQNKLVACKEKLLHIALQPFDVGPVLAILPLRHPEHRSPEPHVGKGIASQSSSSSQSGKQGGPLRVRRCITMPQV